MSDLATVSVGLGERSYDILIGDNLLSDAAHHLAPFIKGRRIAIITDENVMGLHGETLEQSLSGHDEEPAWIVLPAGEEQKSFETLQFVLDCLFQEDMSRSDMILAFGGGVIGDLAGFAASIFKRGCDFIQIPTTLLAQVDSSVGGKTAINVAQGKNLVGAFYQPKLVLADTSVLQTLPERQFRAGYAEVLKYGLLGDAPFFAWLDENRAPVFKRQREALSYIIQRSCETKARIVAEDEREKGVRALLNLGHTFGHALEAEAGYSDKLLHGEAVCVGMDMAFDYSAAQGLCAPSEAARVRAHMEAAGLTSMGDVADLLKPEILLEHMMQDKKNSRNALTLILARKIGEAFVNKDSDQEAVLSYLTNVAETYAG